MLLNSRVGVKYRKFTKRFLSAEEWKTVTHAERVRERGRKVGNVPFLLIFHL